MTFVTDLQIGQNTERRKQAISCEELYHAKRHRLEEPYTIGTYALSSSIFVEMR